MRRVWNQRPPRAVRTASWPEAPSRPEQPPPQGFGAVAAFEREDRSATLGRVPRCLPAPEVTERGARCKRAEGFRTHRAAAAPATGARVHALPRRSARRCTCFRSAAVGGAHVPAAQRRGVRAPVFKAMRGRFTSCRARIAEGSARYRCAPAGGSARAGADGSATGRAEPTAGGVGTTADASARGATVPGRGEVCDERGAKRRREENAGVTAATPASRATSVSVRQRRGAKRAAGQAERGMSEANGGDRDCSGNRPKGDCSGKPGREAGRPTSSSGSPHCHPSSAPSAASASAPSAASSSSSAPS